MSLTKQEIDVLQHTRRNGRYVTDEAFVIEMGKRGLLQDYGPQQIAGGMHYLTLTGLGRQALQEFEASQPKPLPPKPLTRSQRRYRDYLRSESNLSFGEWLKWKHERRELV